MIPLPIILYIIFLIIAFSIAKWKGFTKYRALLAFLIASGCSMIFGGLSHIFVPSIVAKQIGWPVAPEFQSEIGIANILIGILLIFTYKFNKDWILAALVASTIWGWGNALVHILSYMKKHNKSAGNIGWPLYFDIFIPVISIILYKLVF
jgi:hypothetical protein